MTKTTLDIVTLALRSLGVTAADEEPASSDHRFAEDIYLGELELLRGTRGLTLGFDADAVPDALFHPMASIVAAKAAPAYSVQGPSYSRAVMAVRGHLMADDRTDGHDADDDGTVTDDEITSAKRASYY